MPGKIGLIQMVTYPGGGCWGVSIQGFNFGISGRIQVNGLKSDEELVQLAGGEDTKETDFLRRLHALPNIGGYMLLQGGGFTFSMKDHRNCSVEQFSELRIQVFKAFCEVYGFEKLELA